MEPHRQAHGTTPNVPLGRTSRTRGPIQPRINPWFSWCWDGICYGKIPDSYASGKEDDITIRMGLKYVITKFAEDDTTYKFKKPKAFWEARVIHVFSI